MNIRIEKASEKYVKEATLLAKHEYEQECEKNNELIREDYSGKFEEMLTDLFNAKYVKLAFEEDILVGYLGFWGPWDGMFGNVKGVFSPLGCSAFAGSDRGKTASMLYQTVAEDMAADGVFSHALSRYAHDEEIIRSFVLNGFGIRCSDGMQRISERKGTRVLCPEIEFKEIKAKDRKILDELRLGLLKHLAQSPCFFPSDLSGFDSWNETGAKRMFVAIIDGKPAGYYLTGGDGENFITEGSEVVNICGTFVNEEYRGMSVASQLLEYVCQVCEKEGIEYLGVDCETINPTALRFWGKHFSNYTYSLHRRIDERILGYSDYLKDTIKY